MNASRLYQSAEGEKTVMALYDAALKQWSAPYETRYVTTRFGETFVIISGDAASPALVLLHGAGGNSTMWAGDAAEYARRYRVYAVDLIGEAGKSAPERPEWKGEAFADWLEDVFKGLGVERGVVVGISQGAWAALKFSVRQPERIDKLVLMTPGGIVPDRASFLVRAIGWMLLGKWGIRRMVTALFGDQTVPDGVVDLVTTMSAAFKPRMGVLPLFTDAELGRLTMPVLVMGGTKDIMRDNVKIAVRLRFLLPRLTVQSVAGGGHALIGTKDDVLTFLAQQG